MKAVGFYQYLPIDNDEALIDIEIEKPQARGRDILVAIRAISVNPVDTKVRSPKDKIESRPRIIGWDAAGEVVEIGDQVEHYKVGDTVFYAGDITRTGSNSEFQLVDERIVGHMPGTIDFAEAAALPLTSITAWEAIFDRLQISKEGHHAGQSILIIGGAGGVGSIAIQLAKKLAKLKVIATASRSESIDWTREKGADFVINHHKSIDVELEAIGIPEVDYILCLNSTAQHWNAMAKAIAPQGRICSIVETDPVDLDLLKSKSASFVWEFMFTRSMYQTRDMIKQQQLLNEVAQLIDNQVIKTTTNKVFRPINAVNLRQAHRLIEQGNTIGKITLADW